MWDVYGSTTKDQIYGDDRPHIDFYLVILAGGETELFANVHPFESKTPTNPTFLLTYHGRTQAPANRCTVIRRLGLGPNLLITGLGSPSASLFWYFGPLN